MTDSESKNPYLIPVIVAVIGLIGVITTALITNYDKVFGPKATPTPVVVQSPNNSLNNAQTPVATVTTPAQGDQVAVPGLVDLQYNVAKTKLEDEGLAANRVEVEKSDLNPNQVWKQMPKAGAMVARGTQVTLTVVQPARVPLVKGKSLYDALSTLTKEGLNLGNITGPTNSQSGDLLSVNSQDPEQNIEVAKGSRVNIQFSCTSCGVTKFDPKIMIVRPPNNGQVMIKKFVIPDH